MSTQTYDYDVFLSYNQADASEMLFINERLMELGINTWFAEKEIGGGDDVLEKMNQGLIRSKAVAVFFGPHGLGAYQKAELKKAESGYIKGRYKVIPVEFMKGKMDTPNWIESQFLVTIEGPSDHYGIATLASGIKPSFRRVDAPPLPVPKALWSSMSWVGVALALSAAMFIFLRIQQVDARLEQYNESVKQLDEKLKGISTQQTRVLDELDKANALELVHIEYLSRVMENVYILKEKAIGQTGPSYRIVPDPKARAGIKIERK